jgi:hypothetical protein
MRLKGIGSRIGRLEGRTKEGECAGCNKAAAVQIKASLKGISIRERPCSICGNRYPQMSIRYAREMPVFVTANQSES